MEKILLECIGWSGALLVLSAYFLISTDRVTSASSLFQWLNIAGAVGLIIHTIVNRAYPSAFVNIVWVGVGVYGLIKHNRSKNTHS